MDRRRRGKVELAVLALLIALAPPAAPAEPGYDCRALDLNGDRLIQRSEFNQVANGGRSAASGATARAASPLFRNADHNDDGYLSDRELERVPVERGGGWAAVDGDGDGRITPSEFAAVQ